MKAVFADAYYFIALLSPHDQDHQRSLAFTQAFKGRMVTTVWVLTEVADGLCRPPIREQAGLFIERLLQNPDSGPFLPKPAYLMLVSTSTANVPTRNGP